MGSQRKDLVIVQDMNCNQNEYDESIELDLLGFVERSKMLQVLVFLHTSPKKKMEIIENKPYYRNNAVLEKLEQLENEGFVKFTPLGRGKMVSLTEDGVRLASIAVEMFSELKKKMRFKDHN